MSYREQQANDERLRRATELVQRAKDLGLSDQDVRDLCFETGVPIEYFSPRHYGQEELDL